MFLFLDIEQLSHYNCNYCPILKSNCKQIIVIKERILYGIIFKKKEINLCFKDNISISIFQCHLSTPKKSCKSCCQQEDKHKPQHENSNKDNKF